MASIPRFVSFYLARRILLISYLLNLRCFSSFQIMIRNRGKSAKLRYANRAENIVSVASRWLKLRGGVCEPLPAAIPTTARRLPTTHSAFIPHQRAVSPHQRPIPCVATSGNVAASENAVRSWLNRISPWGREGVGSARGGAEGWVEGEGTEGRSVQRTGESGNGAALRHSDTRAHVKWRVHARRKRQARHRLLFYDSRIRASSSSSSSSSS